MFFIYILFLFIICFITSVMGSISGIGGGVILKPVLDAVTGLNVSIISFLSGCTVLSMSIFSLIRYPKNEIHFDKRRGVSLSIGAAVGGILGKNLFSMLLASAGKSSIITIIQSIVLFVLILCVIIYLKYKNKLHSPNVQNLPICFSIGLALGISSSFLGIGGGPINVAAISFFLAMDAKNTAFHSILAIFFSQIFSLLITVFTGSIPVFDYVLLFPMIAGAIFGALTGSTVAKKASNSMMEKLFKFVIYIVMLITIFNIISQLRVLI